MSEFDECLLVGLVETYCLLHGISEDKARGLSIEATLVFHLANEIRDEIDNEILEQLGLL